MVKHGLIPIEKLKNGANFPPIFFYVRIFFLGTEMKSEQKNWVGVEERDVCILRTGSNQSSTSFLL